MKKLIFLENDYKCPASDECIEYGKDNLEYTGIPQEAIDTMDIKYQFSLMDKEEIFKIAFNPDVILVTWSVYTRGSDETFLSLCAAAGRNSVSGITYIDSSGMLPEFLNRRLKEHKNALHAICGINCNTILTYCTNPGEPLGYKRIKIELGDYYEDCVVLEKFETQNILK